MAKKILMALVATFALGATAFADGAETGMKNHDPASLNSSDSSQRDTNLGTQAGEGQSGADTGTSTTSKATDTRTGSNTDAMGTGDTPTHRVGKTRYGRHHHNTTGTRSNTDATGTGDVTAPMPPAGTADDNSANATTGHGTQR